MFSLHVDRVFDNPELAREYDLALAELEFNSKPLINTLTMVAEENVRFARDLTAVLINRIKTVPSPGLGTLSLLILARRRNRG